MTYKIVEMNLSGQVVREGVRRLIANDFKYAIRKEVYLIWKL